MQTLQIIEEFYPNKKIAIGRELTKKFEEIKIDKIINIINYYKNNTLKGEIVCMLYADKKTVNENLTSEIMKLKKLNLKDKEIAKILSVLFEINKNDIYELCLNIK